MAKYLVLKNNVIENIVDCDIESIAQEKGWVEHPEVAGLSIGWVYRPETGEWVDPGITLARTKKRLVMEAQELLVSSDKLVAPDLWENYSQQEKDNIAQYRRELREVPSIVNSESFDPQNYTLPQLRVN